MAHADWLSLRAAFRPALSTLIDNHPTDYGSYEYTYFADGKLAGFKDLNDQIGDPHYVQFHYMSRGYSYDQVGRIAGVGQLPNHSVMPPFTGSYGYDAFGNLTSRGGQYALNSYQSDTSTYTNNRRNNWTYNAQGQVTYSNDTSDSGGSSTRTWTYDAQGALAVTSEVRNGQTTTVAMGYDGDGELMNELFNGTTADYFVRSSVLGSVLTKLKANGGKDITYVPANGLVSPMQMQDQPYSSPPSYMRWVTRDPLGIQESNNGYLSAYDPLGNLVSNVQPPLGGPPPYIPFYGASYGGLSANSFANANNFSSGCLLDGRSTDCNRVRYLLDNNPFVQVDENHSRPWTASPHGQTPQLPYGVREEWKFVRPGQSAPQGAKTKTDYSGELLWYAHHSSYGGGNLFPDPQNTIPAKLSSKDVYRIYRTLKKVRRYMPECDQFIKSVLGKLQELNPNNPPVSTDIVELFRLVQYQPNGGFFVSNSTSSTVDGRIGNGDAKILFLSSTYTYPSRMIHEGFHISGTNYWLGDQQVAQAIGQVDENYKGKVDAVDPRANNAVYSYSYIIDQALSTHCAEKDLQDE